MRQVLKRTAMLFQAQLADAAAAGQVGYQGPPGAYDQHSNDHCGACDVTYVRIEKSSTCRAQMEN